MSCLLAVVSPKDFCLIFTKLRCVVVVFAVAPKIYVMIIWNNLNLPALLGSASLMLQLIPDRDLTLIYFIFGKLLSEDIIYIYID